MCRYRKQSLCSTSTVVMVTSLMWLYTTCCWVPGQHKSVTLCVCECLGSTSQLLCVSVSAWAAQVSYSVCLWVPGQHKSVTRACIPVYDFLKALSDGIFNSYHLNQLAWWSMFGHAGEQDESQCTVQHYGEWQCRKRYSNICYNAYVMCQVRMGGGGALVT